MGTIEAEAYAQWLAPAAALLIVPAGIEGAGRASWLERRLADGLIRMGARKAVLRSGDAMQPHERPIVEERFWREPWRQEGAKWWTTGDLIVTDAPDIISSMDGPFVMGYDLDYREPSPEPVSRTITFYDVRIDPAGLPAVTNEVSKPMAGRRAALWWDDLWIEICRQIYVGDLRPDTQAVIERAMYQWLAIRGHDAGETTIRDRARRLFKALNSEVGN